MFRTFAYALVASLALVSVAVADFNPGGYIWEEKHTITEQRELQARCVSVTFEVAETTAYIPAPSVEAKISSIMKAFPHMPRECIGKLMFQPEEGPADKFVVIRVGTGPHPGDYVVVGNKAWAWKSLRTLVSEPLAYLAMGAEASEIDYTNVVEY